MSVLTCGRATMSARRLLGHRSRSARRSDHAARRGGDALPGRRSGGGRRAGRLAVSSPLPPPGGGGQRCRPATNGGAARPGRSPRAPAAAAQRRAGRRAGSADVARALHLPAGARLRCDRGTAPGAARLPLVCAAGTTTAVLYGAVFEDSLDACFAAAEEHGIRAGSRQGDDGSPALRRLVGDREVLDARWVSRSA